MSGRISNKMVTDGLVFYVDATNIKSFVSGDTVWQDLSINSANCTSSGATVFDSTNPNSLIFNGNRIFRSNSGNTYHMNSGITMSCWLNTTAITVSNVVFSHDSGANDGYRLQIINGNFTFTIGLITDNIFNFNLNGAGWKNISASVSGNTGNFYVDGVLISAGTVGNMIGTPNLFRLGNYQLGGNVNFFGKISKAMLYNRPLNANEILRNFNAHRKIYGL